MTLPTPSLAQDLVRIHKVITRAIDVTMIKGTEYLRSNFGSIQEQLGYSSYTHSLIEVLDAHHQSEDQIAFPALQKLIPAAPYARLIAEHNQIERLLEVMRPAVTKLPTDSQAGLQSLVDALRKLTLLWDPHHQTEEQFFSVTALNEVMSLEDQIRVSAETSKLSQDHSGPPYWVVPFVLFNLGKEDREAMLLSMPPVIMEELVPKAWKDQWAPMKPLLLD